MPIPRSISGHGASLKSAIVRYAQSLGFSRVGIAPADPLVLEQARLGKWLQEGRQGDMGYMEKNASLRAQPRALLPGARSVISLAMSYYTTASEQAASLPGRIARYAWGKDYHKVIGKRLDALLRYIDALVPGVENRTFVDTGPLLERAVAQHAGLGFIGKNTMLITRGLGSWVFLASVVTTLDLPTDEPEGRSCGDCTLCIQACPTGALENPYQLDARRCIAYLTIENKGSIEEPLRSHLGEWLFGCDICQDVCPHNTRIPATPVPEFRESLIPFVPLETVLSLASEEAFQKTFAGSPLRRAKRPGLLRNACLVAANTARHDVLPLLRDLVERDPHPGVREHAAWAIARLEIRTDSLRTRLPNVST